MTTTEMRWNVTATPARIPRGPDWPRTIPEILTCTDLNTQVQAAQDFMDMCDRQLQRAKQIRDTATSLQRQRAQQIRDTAIARKEEISNEGGDGRE